MLPQKDKDGNPVAGGGNRMENVMSAMMMMQLMNSMGGGMGMGMGNNPMMGGMGMGMAPRMGMPGAPTMPGQAYMPNVSYSARESCLPCLTSLQPAMPYGAGGMYAQPGMVPGMPAPATGG